MMKRQGRNNSPIALAIGKDKSVSCRELKRNCDLRSGRYDAGLAQRKYERRMREKPERIRFTEAVRRQVEALLEEDYSPEQEAGQCRLEGAERISHERICRHVWEDKRRGGDLHTHLRRKGRRYRKRGAAKDSRGFIRDRTGIEKHHAIVEQRSRLGDLELDTVIGKNHKGALLTVNDRVTGICWCCSTERNPDRYRRQRERVRRAQGDCWRTRPTSTRSRGSGGT